MSTIETHMQTHNFREKALFQQLWPLFIKIKTIKDCLDCQNIQASTINMSHQLFKEDIYSRSQQSRWQPGVICSSSYTFCFIDVQCPIKIPNKLYNSVAQAIISTKKKNVKLCMGSNFPLISKAKYVKYLIEI
jgi:hypothetical protein